MLNLAEFRCQKPKTLPITLILGETGFFTEKHILYFVSTVLSKIVGKVDRINEINRVRRNNMINCIKTIKSSKQNI